MKLNTYFALVTSLLYNSLAIGQLEISEYSASNLNGFLDSFAKTEDWIEIYNNSNETIDISGYGISDKETKPLKWRFPIGTTLGPNEYMHVWCSGRDLLANGIYHTNFKLTQTKGNEFVVISDPTGNIIESTAYQLTLTEHSRIKINGEWLISASPSPGNGQQNNIYNAYTNAPIISLEPGFYNGTQVVTVEQNDTNVTTHYTIDGHEPTLDSPEYIPGSSISINETSVFKAKNFSTDPNILPGKIDYASYFIDENFTLPVFSIASDRVQDLANGQGEVIPIGTIEYFDENKNFMANSYGSLNRHGQDSWVNPHRSLDWVSRDEMGYNKAVIAKLFNYSERTEYQRFMMRASGDDNYPAINDFAHEGSCHIRDEYVHELAQKGNMKLDLRAVERVIVFLNGDYWGVYGLRERPVDHDYTKEFYDQDKYHLHYLLTWGNTWAEYGGEEAFEEWEEFRDWVLNNDMGIPENYEIVKDNFQVLSLIDYMITNLNVVSQDWLNYNTGWWKGTNPEGGHKKWGYILWDNDATFDYYINYTGVPNTNPDAVPCDIDIIAQSMDQFYGGGFGGGGGGNDHGGEIIDNPDECETILNGSSPYPSSDSIFIQVINNDNYCCCVNWNSDCQSKYDEIINTNTALPVNYNNCGSIMNQSCPYPAEDLSFQITINQFPDCCINWSPLCESIYELAENDIFNGDCEADPGSGNGVTQNNDVGKHEKIFLKLQDENEDFRQLYYSRQADLINTVFSCENMLSTLDSMLNTIRPEMPRHIQRWGGSLAEWESNVDQLIDFVTQRCQLLDDGMVECFEVEGPYDLTIDVRPIGVGKVKLNTINLNSFPWTGSYFGNMNNLLKATPLDDEIWKFSHWEIDGDSSLSPDINNSEAKIQINNHEKVTAVFTDELSSTDDVIAISELHVYPSPAKDHIIIEYLLLENDKVNIELTSILGHKIQDLTLNKYQNKGKHNHRMEFSDKNIAPGLYNLTLSTEQETASRKITIIK